MGLFTVTAAEAAVIREAWVMRGEISAAIEVQRLFRGITDMADAMACARTIASWTPRSTPP